MSCMGASKGEASSWPRGALAFYKSVVAVGLFALEAVSYTPPCVRGDYASKRKQASHLTELKVRRQLADDGS